VCELLALVVLVTGRGWAGFHSPGPPLHVAGGGDILVIPADSLDGALFLATYFYRGSSGECAGQGAGAGNPQKTSPSPQAVQWGWRDGAPEAP